MKISMILVAGAQAFTCADRGLTCDLRDWVENNWWALAVETFNFASNNREAYTHAIKSVSRAESPGMPGRSFVNRKSFNIGIMEINAGIKRWNEGS